MARRRCCQGIPAVQMFLLCAALFASCVGITFVFPFLPFQVAYFGVDVARSGYYAGTIGCSYMIGRAISSVPWGIVSDRHGRKRVLVASMYLMAAATMAYGLSPNFVFSVASRFLCGFSNGILGPGKSLASEICAQDEQTQATAMTYVMTAFGFGVIIGPAIGGWLAEPASKFPSYFSTLGVFGRIPFFLPALIVALGILVCGMLVHRYLEDSMPLVASTADKASVGARKQTPHPRSNESHRKVDNARSKHGKKHAAYRSVGETENESIASTQSASGNDAILATAYGSPTEQKVDIVDNTCETTDSIYLEKINSEQPPSIPQPLASSKREISQQKGNMRLLMEEPLVGFVVLLYCILGFVDFVTTEVLPLWAAAPISRGGLSWDSSQVGTLIGTVAAGVLVLQLLLYPPLVGCFGVLPFFRFCVAVMIATCIFLPWLPSLTHHSASYLWPALIATRGLQEFCKQSLFIASFGFVNNSTTIQQRGLVNGVAISLASLTKALGPLVGGTVFSLTVASELAYPLNIHGPWILMSLVYSSLLILSFRLPPSISRPREAVPAKGAEEPDQA